MEVLASEFLKWYFSDREELFILGWNIAQQLGSTGKAEVTVEELYDSCGYIPGHLVKGVEDCNGDFDPQDLKLINDLNL
jgi:hypothetical protein